MIQTLPLAWGKRVDQPFRDRLFLLCGELSWTEEHASWLMACMAFETGRTFSPSIRNSASTATGLIQFMSSTAKYLGTTTASLAKMSAVRQLDYVERYFAPQAAKVKSLDDMYLAILWPAAVGKPGDHVLWRKGEAAYRANRGLDLNQNGTVTKGEAAAKAWGMLAEGMRPGNVYLPVGYV